jgi:acyl-coenzyme A thioesterase PaaI-like protein
MSVVSRIEPIDDPFALTRIDGRTFRLDPDPRLSSGERLHGGYLVALLAQAAADALRGEVDHPHPLAISVQFTSAAETAPAEIAVEVLRAGRNASQLMATLHQDGSPRALALITMGRLDRGPDRYLALDPPSMPPVEECVRLPLPGKEGRLPLWDFLDLHIDPATAGWTRRDPAGIPLTQGWLTPPAPTIPWLLVAADAMPAVTLEFGSRGWVPTFELTAYVRALPSPGRLRLRQTTKMIGEEHFDQHCEIWDRAGRLVAHSTQLTGVRFPSRGTPPSRH